MNNSATSTKGYVVSIYQTDKDDDAFMVIGETDLTDGSVQKVVNVKYGKEALDILNTLTTVTNDSDLQKVIKTIDSLYNEIKNTTRRALINAVLNGGKNA